MLHLRTGNRPDLAPSHARYRLRCAHRRRWPRRPGQFRLTHASCNRAKQASNLEVARILSRFARPKELLVQEIAAPIWAIFCSKPGGGHLQWSFEVSADHIRYSFSETGDNQTHQVSLHEDDLSGSRYFFAKLLIQFLAHDTHINKRPIRDIFNKLGEEFSTSTRNVGAAGAKQSCQ